MRFAALGMLMLLAAAGAPRALAEGAKPGEAPPPVPVAAVDSQPLGPVVIRAHAIAMHGEPKYGPGFKHFDYVNPDAPKGGEIRLAAEGTFDSFNPYNDKGNPAGVAYETLLTPSADEAFTEYGLIAESLEWPLDRSWVIFHLRPEAHWHDGEPITVEDVIYSLETLKAKGQPFYRYYYRAVQKAEKVGPRSVKFTFNEKGNRELPLIVGQMPIIPKHYWESRDFGATTLEPPLTSGPYKITKFEPGRYYVQERVKDYWGKDLPVRVGTENFDRIRTDFFLDATVIREALKSGSIDYREENQAKAWALDYDVPAVRNGWLIKAEVPNQRPTGMQAFIFNTRRPLFQDPRVREALGYAFDFEWTNKVLFFGQYTRTRSYFSNSELASRGLPEGQELEVLDRFRDQLPAEVFDKPFTVPETDGTGWPRANLLKALALLKQAGWVVDPKSLKLVNEKTRQPFRFEILLTQQAFERIVLPFTRNLKRLGIDANVRLVDQSQYINRLRSFDYDMISLGWGESDSPGNEQRNYWTSESAKRQGSQNYAGIESPVVDKLVDLVINAPDRESLVARTRALDRVLLWGQYVIPAWHLAMDRILYWDKYSRPEVTPKDGTAIDYWWYDAAKAAALQARESQAQDQDKGGGASAERRGPSPSVIIALLAGLLLVGGWVARRAVTGGRK
ncbi:microcin C transport system substrate-binding protein [Tistlia consotensis]|uniref:Microcin C transport system substrate-binding protein n=1 Tax=Tistlia consotensis USBA 355 TaxID=560819 RepID=A0A1Y6BKK4_9PROT|nr:extracellular solute-binding protein [Tistlia consotensis]SMF07513.1 microcin C transport system substrate-binding protein [Tistlia consotensis USBA 355]SNR35838.1 microcin C transport system substrate-binding protein [Tistlia consotensis]